LPLDLVASTRALSWGRRVGVENSVLSEHQIVVDGREAWAMTGLRRWRTQSIGFSTVLVRTCGRIAELTLHADPSMLDALATDWGALLDSVRLAAPVAQSPIFAEEAWRNDAGCSGPERSVRR
jgi:hypothetical protein